MHGSTRWPTVVQPGGSVSCVHAEELKATVDVYISFYYSSFIFPFYYTSFPSHSPRVLFPPPNASILREVCFPYVILFFYCAEALRIAIPCSLCAPIHYFYILYSFFFFFFVLLLYRKKRRVRLEALNPKGSRAVQQQSGNSLVSSSRKTFSRVFFFLFAQQSSFFFFFSPTTSTSCTHTTYNVYIYIRYSLSFLLYIYIYRSGCTNTFLKSYNILKIGAEKSGRARRRYM